MSALEAAPPVQDPEAKWMALRAAGQLPMQLTRQRYAARQREAKMRAKAAAKATAAAAAAAQQQQEQQKEAASAAAANPADAPRATEVSECVALRERLVAALDATRAALASVAPHASKRTRTTCDADAAHASAASDSTARPEIRTAHGRARMTRRSQHVRGACNAAERAECDALPFELLDAAHAERADARGAQMLDPDAARAAADVARVRATDGTAANADAARCADHADGPAANQVAEASGFHCAQGSHVSFPSSVFVSASPLKIITLGSTKILKSLCGAAKGRLHLRRVPAGRHRVSPRVRE